VAQVLEQRVYQSLRQYRGEGVVDVGPTTMHVSLDTEDVHTWTSPDFILWMNVRLELFGHRLSIRLPIPVEAEKAGWKAAIEDLDKFAEREQFSLELPMIVVADAGTHDETTRRHLNSLIHIRQIPVRDT